MNTIEPAVQTASTQKVAENPARRLLGDLGKPGARWWGFVAFLLCVIGLGMYAYARQEIDGEVITGMRTIGAGGASWGLYIVGVVFFIGLTFVGITIAAIIRLLNIESIRPLSRVAELLTITSLMMGATCVIADLGMPMNGLLNLPKYARPMSPFFYTFSLVVGGYLFASLAYFYLAGRADAAACVKAGVRFSLLHRIWASGYSGTPGEKQRHHRTSFWLALLILPLMIADNSALGFIFGTQGGRPGWFNALAGPGFVVLAGVSGIGALIVISAAIRKFMHLEDIIRLDAFRWLGNLLLALTTVYMYFMVSEAIPANYAAAAVETKIANEVVFGVYAPLFWTLSVCLVVAFGLLFTQFVRRTSSIPLVVTAGVLVNVAAILKRYLIVVPSQTHGMLLPFEQGSYSPSWVELSVLAGLFALGTLIYMTFLKFFPILPIEHHHVDTGEVVEESLGSRVVRSAAFVGCLAVGITMAVVGFVYSARYGTEDYLDPVLPYAPVIFITGIVTCFMSAVVYEIVPGRPAVKQEKRAGEGEIAPGVALGTQ